MADDVIGRYFAHPPTPSVSSDEPFVDASVDPCSHGERALEDNESAGRHDEGSSPRTRKIQSSSTTPVAGTRTASSIMQELSGKYLRVYRRRKRRKRQDLPPDPVEEFSSLGDTGGIYPADEVLELDCSCEEVLDDAPAAAPPPIMLHDQVAADSCGNMPSSWQRVAPRCAARRRRKSLEQLGAARFALWPSSSMTKNRSDDFSADYSPSSTSSADSLTRTVWRTSCTPESSANRSSSTLKRSRNRTTPRCPPDLRAEGTGWTRLWHCGLARKAPSDVTLVLKTGWDGLLSLQKNLVRCRRRKGDLPFFAKSQRHRRSENQFLDRTNRFSDEKMPPSSSDHRGPGQHLGRFLGVWLLLCVSFATTSPPEDAHPHLVRTTYKLTEPINAEVDGRKTAFTQVAEQPLASAPTAQHESSMKSTPQHAGVQARERRLHEKAATAPRRILDEASDNIVAQRIRRETAEYDRPKNAQASTTGGSHDSNGLLQRHFAHNADLFEQRKDGSIVQRHDGKEVAPPTEPKARERRDLEMGNRRALLASIDEKTGKIKDRDAHRKAANEIHRFNVAERRRLSAAGAVDPSGEVSDEALAEEGNQNAHGGANTRQLATASTEGSIIYPEFVKQEVCRGMDERRPGYYCGERWGITNIVKVEDQWKINELEFFWDAHCTNPVVGVSKQQSFSDETFSNEDTSALAFDGNNKTMYTANCRASLSGCPAFIPGVQGQRIDNEGRLNTVIYKQLVRDDEVPDLFGNVKLYDPAKTTVTQDGAIKCVRIFQSPITTEQAYRIGVVFWDTLQWVKYDEFDSLAGGGWQSRPAGSITIWKLTNGNPTASPWTVNELYFYGDRRCDYVLSGIPVGTENVRELPQCHEAGTCDDTSVEKIRDGDITTAFKARCSETEVSAPCSSNYAFIGYDYGYTPRTVLCIKIWQEAHAGYGQAWHVSQHSEALQLQSWDGRGWRVDKNLYNLLPNKWNYDYAPMNTLWRLTADVVIPEWRVAEIEFFNNPFCDTTDESGLVQVLPIQRVPLPGTAFDSNTVLALNDEQIACADSQILSSCSAKVFDGKIDTFWQGSCRPNEPCERESNYIGIFSDLPIDVQCFKIFQSQDPRYSVVTLHISTWDGNGGWQIPNPWSSLSSTISGIQNDLGGGSWNRRPAFQYSMWKFSNGVSTQLQWRVVDVHIYADIHCTERMDGIAWLASGSESMANSVVAASDGNNQTFWEAKCLGNTLGCDRFTAWLGVQRTYNRPEILESNVPQCLVVDQYRDAAFQSGDIRMETWNGIRWYDPKAEFTTASNDYKTYYAGIGGGTGQARPAFSGTQWRLRASDSVEIWWVLTTIVAAPIEY
ncbi:unnamed protein product [Amoebophrya sp. A25]|nr:unnamed protein product [Amoebophrya sp. A25]|eukprot:GSA25T00011142001.1